MSQGYGQWHRELWIIVGEEEEMNEKNDMKNLWSMIGRGEIGMDLDWRN